MSCETKSQRNAKPFAPLSRIARRLFLKRIQPLSGGKLAIVDALGKVALGDDGELQAIVRVRNLRLYRQLLLSGTLGAAASYLRGDWDCENLTDLCRLLLKNAEANRQIDRRLPGVTSLWHRVRHRLRANTKSNARANIAAHYDLGNEFFQLWLDDTMAYSSGMFVDSDDTLQDASVEKFDRVCRKLDLKPGDRLLEIGTGWGGFALHAAANYGCRVTTTTLSRKQFEVARERISDAGLADQVTLLMRDYRDLSGRFDKLASIEMIEAVGYRHFDAFFRKCSELLEPEGSAVIQSIVLPDQHYADYLRSVDFIQRYVFPGGCLPSLGAMIESTARASDLRLVHVEDFGLHYAETLRRWRHAFFERLEDVRQLGYSDEFVRLWTFYLCYCEAAFEERYTSVVQVLFDKPGCRRDALQIGQRAAASSTECVRTGSASIEHLAVGPSLDLMGAPS